MADLHIVARPPGTWGFQAFMGRLENHPILSSSMSGPSARARLIARTVPPDPHVQGLPGPGHLRAAMEFYLNTMDLWGGTLNGKGLTAGYGLVDYLTARRAQGALAEANADFSNHPATGAPYREPTPGAPRRWTWASGCRPVHRQDRGRPTEASAYISRGSKDAVWPVRVFVKDPPITRQGVKKDLNNLFASPNLGYWWNPNSRYTAPSLGQPNDTVGILVDLAGGAGRAGVLGLRRHPDRRGFRPFTHGTYLTGFYYDGDPLGEALGGETVGTTAKVEVDSPPASPRPPRHAGVPPVPGQPGGLAAGPPGPVAGKNRFAGLQQTLAWKRATSPPWTGRHLAAAGGGGERGGPGPATGSPGSPT